MLRACNARGRRWTDLTRGHHWGQPQKSRPRFRGLSSNGSRLLFVAQSGLLELARAARSAWPYGQPVRATP
jgi:hypothetical protein